MVYRRLIWHSHEHWPNTIYVQWTVGLQFYPSSINLAGNTHAQQNSTAQVAPDSQIPRGAGPARAELDDGVLTEG